MAKRLKADGWHWNGSLHHWHRKVNDQGFWLLRVIDGDYLLQSWDYKRKSPTSMGIISHKFDCWRKALLMVADILMEKSTFTGKLTKKTNGGTR